MKYVEPGEDVPGLALVLDILSYDDAEHVADLVAAAIHADPECNSFTLLSIYRED